MANTATAHATTTRAAHAADAPRTTGRVLSSDGTVIAFNRMGAGTPLILVDSALCHRRLGPGSKIARLLAPHFTVITFDRRGRGESGDTAPYTVEREVEDIAALVDEAGGSAYLWGTSSGAVLALEAASRLGGIKGLALYEAPFIVDDTGPVTEHQWTRIGEAVSAGRRGAAVGTFLQMVGVPRPLIVLMRLSPMWTKLKAIAHTLPYDGLIVRDHQQRKPLASRRWASVTVPTLVMDGEKSPPWMRGGNRALAAALPSAHYRTLHGQTHTLNPKAHASVLVEFFHGESRGHDVYCR